MIIKIFSGCLAAFFFWAASLQFNDPDPLHWIIFYALVGVLFVLNIYEIIYRPLIFFSLGMIFLQLLIAGDGAITWYLKGAENITAPMNNNKPYIEEMREFLGSLIALTATLWLLFLSRNQTENK